jgi:hypothetical protein
MNVRKKSFRIPVSDYGAQLEAGSAATPLARSHTGPSLASRVPPAGDENRVSSENERAAERAGREHEQSAHVADDGREAIQSSPVSRAQGKTLQHQVQELYRLVDGAIEDLEQVLRALRTIDKDL